MRRSRRRAVAGAPPGPARAFSPKPLLACGLLLCACGLLPPALRAEVFWRLPKRADTVLQQMGGARVYATDVELNGAPGALTAYAFERSASEIGSELARRLGLPAPSAFGATMLTHAEKERLLRVFVLPAASGSGGSVVLSFDLPLREAERSRLTPPEWPANLPALSATPLFTAVCTQTRSTFVTAESAAEPEAAAQEAAQLLAGAGWSEALPSTATFKLFAAGRKQCVLFASRNPETAKTTISLLQREGATP